MTTKSVETNEYRIAIANLKQALKQRGITYRDLAEGIGLSESGVKKIFLAKDGSFLRLAEICRYVGVSIGEILENRKTFEVGFTEAQQKEFLKNSVLFEFYWLLVYERRSLLQSQETLRISKSEAFRLARKLDLLGMVKLLPGERLRVPSIKAVRWKSDGEFLRMLYLKWSLSLVKTVARPVPSPEDLFLVGYMQMTSKTYEEFCQALRNIEEEFVRRSIQEMRMGAQVKHVRYLLASDNKSFVTGDGSGLNGD